MKLTYKVLSDTGLVRTRNEDCILVGNQIIRNDEDSFTFDIPDSGIVFPAIVCDGLGGHASGDEASMTVCREFQKFFETLDPSLDENGLIMTLKHEAADCNRILLRQADGCGMCSTLTGFLLYGDKAFILNAGDSRVYRIRYDHLKQLTTDHITAKFLRRVIVNCFGLEEVSLDVMPVKIVSGDKYIICSDGLFDMVPEYVIEDSGADAEFLKTKALEAGGYDNISIIVLSFE